MPIGVYDRSVRLTDEQKKERIASRAKLKAQYRITHREEIAEKEKRYRDATRERRCEQERLRYAKRRESMLEKAKRHYAKNQERLRAYSKKYHSENRDVLTEKMRQYKKANRDKINRYNRQYRKDHPDIVRQNRSRRRAIQRNAPIGEVADISVWVSKWRSQKTVACHWCRKRIKTSDAHVDHVIPIAKGGEHSLGNLCVSCAPCNHSKHAKMPEDWNASLPQPLLFV